MAKSKKTKTKTKTKTEAPSVDNEVAVPAVDPESALAAARSVADRLAIPATRARFVALPKDALDPKHVAAYPDLFARASAAATEYMALSASETNALVPFDVVSRATDLRTRMFSCAVHNLMSTPDAARRIDAIRPGSGHRDMLSDLRGLASLYDDYASVLVKDGNHYQSSDVPAATAAAAEIQAALASGQRAATKKARRSWARDFEALRVAHDEVIATGRWLDRHAADPIGSWPSLYVSLGAPRTRAKKQKTGGAATSASAPSPSAS